MICDAPGTPTFVPQLGKFRITDGVPLPLAGAVLPLTAVVDPGAWFLAGGRIRLPAGLFTFYLTLSVVLSAGNLGWRVLLQSPTGVPTIWPIVVERQTFVTGTGEVYGGSGAQLLAGTTDFELFGTSNTVVSIANNDGSNSAGVMYSLAVIRWL